MRGSRRLATRGPSPPPVGSWGGQTHRFLRWVGGRPPALPLRGGGPPALRAPPRPAGSSFGATTSGARTPRSPYLHAFTRIVERLQAESVSARKRAGWPRIEPMKIVSIGGGPAGLYFSLLMKKADPAHDITVVERNRADDPFGVGVVFPGATPEHFPRAGRRGYAAVR